MARKKKTRLPDGRTVEGSSVPFQTGGEHWNEYLIEDGSMLKVKLVATDIIKVDGEYDDQGNPLYALHSTQVVVVDSPEDLQREES
ncbi:MAG: hypothetical protein H0X19_00320 [Rubrobacter sp.]|nr:hypothetical protein [Rubrobacteraceae bacterium]MBA3792567.1 hypothetical protein [Rubrobacter sp.]MDQ3315846.1 hypothetical protein [Actinomycetota bacterium]MDQ3428714.1 hypothetical protein [Actinomycetota bacterium]